MQETEDIEEKLSSAQENQLNIDWEWATVCIQKRAQQILSYLPTQLADIVSQYELPAPDELNQAKAQLEKAFDLNDPALTFSALNTFANPNGKLPCFNDYLSYSLTKDPKIIEALLIYRANPNPPSFLMIPILHRVSNPCVVPLLIQYKANIDAVDSKGENALYHNGIRAFDASLPSSETYTLIKTLIAHKVNPNHIDEDGVTPLHQASGAFHYEYVKALLEDKANVHATDRWGDTALYLVTKTIFEDQQENAMKTMELLVNAGADPYIKNNEGKTALDRAQCFDARRDLKMAGAIIQVYREKQKPRNTCTQM